MRGGPLENEAKAAYAAGNQQASDLVTRASLLVAPGLTTSNKKLLVKKALLVAMASTLVLVAMVW